MHGIFGLLCSHLSYRLKSESETDGAKIREEFEKIIIDGIKI